ncbi:MAG: hypothetical protein U0T36_09180 [Saprospiraceae bacterium]
MEKGNKGIDIQNNFEPTYVVSPEKTKVVRELKEQVKSIRSMAGDGRRPRRRSDLLAPLSGVKIDVKTTKRIVFSEITKPAIQKQ